MLKNYYRYYGTSSKRPEKKWEGYDHYFLESDKDLEKGDFKIVLVDNMEGFVAPTSSPCVVDLHEEVFDFSCYLDDTEKVVDTILSMTPQAN